MKKHIRTMMMLPAAMMILLLVGNVAPARAGGDNDDNEIPLDEANVFFELNNTDGDLGIHALIDGEPWRSLTIETPDGRENLKITLRGRMRQQGLTELFFESAEPTFDELSPEEFFARFPEGIYEIEGISIEGEELEGEAEVTHLMPAPAGNLSVNGMAVPEDCDAGPVPSVSEPFMVDWDPVTHSHPDLGRKNEPITVVRYELVLEREEPTELKYSVVLPPGVTELTIPSGLAASGEEWKIEVLVREESGNQTAVESCFEVD